MGRLNIGGPALHVMNLWRRLDSARFQQILVVGSEREGEGSLLAQARSQGIDPVVIRELVTALTPHVRDVVALVKLCRLIRQTRPHIVHTHTAKAGFLGRLAARLCGVPVIVHTYHGHVLRGYFGPITTRLVRRVERMLAGITDRIVAVSAQVKLELAAYEVAAPDKISVIPLGLELEPFLSSSGFRGELRRELGFGAADPIVGIVGRIVPIKNHGLFLRAAARIARESANCRFVIVGDGPLRAQTEQAARKLGIRDRVRFLGWRFDLPRIYADLNALVVSSDNEGTPVAAIEAMAAGCPVVATRVGGLPDLISHERTGFLVPPGDAHAMAEAVLRVLTDRDIAARITDEAKTLIPTRFSADRLGRDMADLYDELLAAASQRQHLTRHRDPARR